jgi:hypothetical protein
LHLQAQTCTPFAAPPPQKSAPSPPTTPQGEAFAFFSAIEPLVAQASASSAAAVSKLLKPGTPVAAGTAAAVGAALEKAYAGLGVAAADVGVYGTKCAATAI